MSACTSVIKNRPIKFPPLASLYQATLDLKILGTTTVVQSSKVAGILRKGC